MQIRDRIRELRRVPAATLRPNPRNWRRHPQRQHDAVRAMLADVGYADALLVRELADGSLELIDGHLRAETTPDALVPVLVLDVDEQEAARLLATLDPLAGLAETDRAQLAELRREIALPHPELERLLAELLDDEQPSAAAEREVAIPEAWQLLVDCGDEATQQALYERLTAEGLRCRVLTL